MRVQTEEWRRFIPGVRMYKGKKTLFYNGETLWEGGWNTGDPLIYDYEERESWEVVIVLPGVEIIPEWAFDDCSKLEVVIMSDSVRRIEEKAFYCCLNLVHVRLSRNLEYIGGEAFNSCDSLTSIFIPDSCREIGYAAFEWCDKLIIFSVPQHTQLGEDVIASTALKEVFDDIGFEELNIQIKNLNMNQEFDLHRACSSCNPNEGVIYEIVKRKGLSNFQVLNAIGITPTQYLEVNPYADINQQKLIKRYIVEMMGETI